jgi:hypothetical protein
MRNQNSRHSLGIQVGNQPLPAGLSLNVSGQGTSVHNELVELDEPTERCTNNYSPPPRPPHPRRPREVIPEVVLGPDSPGAIVNSRIIGLSNICRTTTPLVALAR